MLWHDPGSVNGKRKEMARKGKSLRSNVLKAFCPSQKKSEHMAKPAQLTSAFVGWFLGFGVLSKAFLGQCVQVRDLVWPPRCGKEWVKFRLRDTVEATKAGNGKPEVATSATGHSHLCPQSGRGRKRASRVRHRAEHFCLRSARGGAPLLTALGAGFARNPQRPLGLGKFLPQSLPHSTGSYRARNLSGRLPLARPQVLPTFAERQLRQTPQTTES